MNAVAIDDNLHGLVRDLTSTLATIARDFGERASSVARATPAIEVGADQHLVDRAVRLIEEQQRRSDYLPRSLFHDPAWTMLLALFIAHHERRVLNIKALAALADAPATTSLRWVDHLNDSGLIKRVTDPMDRRRVEVSLTDKGVSALTDYLTGL